MKITRFLSQARSDWIPIPQNPNLTEVFDRFGFVFPVKDAPHAASYGAAHEAEYRSVEPFPPAPQYFPHGAKLAPPPSPPQLISITPGSKNISFYFKKFIFAGFKILWCTSSV